MSKRETLLGSETDEQSLQVALVSSERASVVSLQEVSISGYFRPHLLELGSCGAHFVGVNVKHLPFAHGFWDEEEAEVERRVSCIAEIAEHFLGVSPA